MDRRTFLTRACAAATGAGVLRGVGTAGGSGAGRAAPVDRTTETVLEGTEHETPLYVIEAPQDGPTAFVLGGLHGNERCGFRAAEAVSKWGFDAGRVVVLPRANQVAIERNARKGPSGDLNRQFPPGEEPETTLARGIWEAVTSHDPDVVFDLHESGGIYGFHYGYVGQAVFPTAGHGAPERATAVADALNESVVPWYMPYHDYQRGNVMRGTAPLLAHKVVADLGRPAYIVETARFLLDLRTRTRWETEAARMLLARYGLGPRPDGGGR